MSTPDRHSGARRAPDVRAYFDRESAHYVAERYVRPSCDQFSYETRRRLALSMLGAGPGRLLDIGSGPGVMTRELLGRGYTVCEVDLSLEMLRNSRNSVAAPDKSLPISFVQGCLPELPFSDHSFDTAACIGVLSYLRDPAEALKQIRRVLKPNGVLVLQASNALCPTARLHALLRRGFREVGEFLGGPAYPHLRIPLTSFRLGTLRRTLARENFKVESCTFYDFRPPLIQWVAPSLALATAKGLQGLQRRTSFSWLAEGMLLKVRAC